MKGETKTYTKLEKDFVADYIAQGCWIGSKFLYQDRLMVITTIGKAYVKEDEWLIDYEAREIQLGGDERRAFPRPPITPRLGGT